MPTYEYACTACGHRLEAVQKFTDDPLTECPECGAAQAPAAVHCPSCGSEAAPGAKFCANCGAGLTQA